MALEEHVRDVYQTLLNLELESAVSGAELACVAQEGASTN